MDLHTAYAVRLDTQKQVYVLPLKGLQLLRMLAYGKTRNTE